MTQHLKCFAGTDFLSSTLPEIVRSDLTTTTLIAKHACNVSHV